MAQNPPRGSQRLVPMLVYANAPAAIDFLCKAFGFEERFRMPMPDGRVGHAELGYRESIFTLSSEYPELGFASPLKSETRYSQLMCYVDDVDAHYENAVACGATVIAEPEDQFHGARMYRAVDPEGHRWIFATQVKDVDLGSLEGPA